MAARLLAHARPFFYREAREACWLVQRVAAWERRVGGVPSLEALGASFEPALGAWYVPEGDFGHVRRLLGGAKVALCRTCLEGGLCGVWTRTETFAWGFVARKPGDKKMPREASPPGRADAREEALRLLGLADPVTKDEVVAAYRKKALEVHPDRGGSDAAMAQATAARDLLLQEVAA